MEFIKKSAPLFLAFIFVFSSLFLILGGSVSQAAPEYRPLREILDYETFESLIRYNSARVPELSKLWSQNGNVDTSQAYWGGGTLRGFLHWHYIQLQTHTVEEIKKMPLPTLAKLQLPGGKDVDIFAPLKIEGTIQKILKRIKDLDVLDLANIPQYAKLGGATLEKIAVNPYSVVDISGGFRHYYEGRIVFRLTDDEEIKSSRFSDADYTKTGESIRFIRFAHFNLPELENDPQNIQMIKKIAGLELDQIKEEGKVAWIETSLEKLLAASQGDLPAVLSLLHEYNLLVVLLHVGVYIPPEQLGAAREWLTKNSKNLDPAEKKALQENYGLFVDGDRGQKCVKEIDSVT